ncbi:hypothetical protein CR513_19693, partial [Mucuna pruriens]
MVKQLRGKEIPLVKVIWGGATPESATWELEEKMRESYPDLFVSAKPRGERTQICKEEELGCLDRPGAASDPRCSSHLSTKENLLRESQRNKNNDFDEHVFLSLCFQVMLRTLVVLSFEEARSYSDLCDIGAWDLE